MEAGDQGRSTLPHDASRPSDEESYAISHEDSPSDDTSWFQPWVFGLVQCAEKKIEDSTTHNTTEIPTNADVSNNRQKDSGQACKLPTPAAATDVVANPTASTSKPEATSSTDVASKTETTDKTGAGDRPKSRNKKDRKKKGSRSWWNMAKEKSRKRGATVKAGDSGKISFEVSASLEGLELEAAEAPDPQQQSNSAGIPVCRKPPTNASKKQPRKCANCGKGDGVKLKRCALCVQKKKGPAYYCSRECQVEDWEDHQKVHVDDYD